MTFSLSVSPYALGSRGGSGAAGRAAPPGVSPGGLPGGGAAGGAGDPPRVLVGPRCGSRSPPAGKAKVGPGAVRPARACTGSSCSSAGRRPGPLSRDPRREKGSPRTRTGSPSGTPPQPRARVPRCCDPSARPTGTPTHTVPAPGPAYRSGEAAAAARSPGPRRLPAAGSEVASSPRPRRQRWSLGRDHPAPPRPAPLLLASPRPPGWGSGGRAGGAVRCWVRGWGAGRVVCHVPGGRSTAYAAAAPLLCLRHRPTRRPSGRSGRRRSCGPSGGVFGKRWAASAGYPAGQLPVFIQTICALTWGPYSTHGSPFTPLLETVKHLLMSISISLECSTVAPNQDRYPAWRGPWDSSSPCAEDPPEPATETWEQGCQAQAEHRAPGPEPEGELLPGCQVPRRSRGDQVDSLPLSHLGSPVHVWRSPLSPRAAGKDTETTAKTQERRSVFPWDF
ncbi:unnamed protein product [Rangifer tarandus platyrhynchus]|uniref:Uncharacterized protein n=1 Tax=Rangifer tarandus platyrhynchus TaxID=3082113 RepID=A0AC60A8I7_RANTA